MCIVVEVVVVVVVVGQSDVVDVVAVVLHVLVTLQDSHEHSLPWSNGLLSLRSTGN